MPRKPLTPAEPVVSSGQRGLDPASQPDELASGKPGAGTEKADSPVVQQADGLSLFPHRWSMFAFIAWAWQQEVSHTDKIVLLALSDYADSEGYSFPSAPTMT